jgi:tRNA-Thr(GGU) m(6)t(6)A37 methyltransferase TsaA
MGSKKSIQINPIGTVRRGEESVSLVLSKEYIPALKNLDKFSHVMVLWWADKHDNEKSRKLLDCEPPYAEGHVTGVFATRAEYRPNPVAVTTAKILDVNEEEGVVEVSNIDAFDGTPIVDLKAYFPVLDRVKDAVIPDWLQGWPEWMPDEGVGLDY